MAINRLLLAVTATTALVLAACGSSSKDDTSAGPPAGDTTVSVSNVDGVGQVLVDPSGKPLYMSDEEANGMILCTDACLSFWKPLAAPSDNPTAPAGVSDLGVIQRPDGTQQVTQDGKPLYTFAQDSPGQVKGDGFSDDFGSQHFTWHVAHADGSVSSTPATSSAGGYGY
jgi:predicted lipoprotein with Yx(FWY)xxD motif